MDFRNKTGRGRFITLLCRSNRRASGLDSSSGAVQQVGVDGSRPRGRKTKWAVK